MNEIEIVVGPFRFVGRLETELATATCKTFRNLLPAYGGVCFASKVGQLAGNHFLTVIQGSEMLPDLGRKVLWEGAQDIIFSQL